MPVCDSADKAEIGAAVSFESEERLCQVALASKFVRVKGLGPERGSRSAAGRLFDLCCVDCSYTIDFGMRVVWILICCARRLTVLYKNSCTLVKFLFAFVNKLIMRKGLNVRSP